MAEANMLHAVITANDSSERQAQRPLLVCECAEGSSEMFCLIDLLLNWFHPHVIRALKINDL